MMVRTDEINTDRLCKHCGYNLRMLENGQRCPECGEQFYIYDDMTTRHRKKPILGWTYLCLLLGGSTVCVLAGNRAAGETGAGHGMAFSFGIHFVVIGIMAIKHKELLMRPAAYGTKAQLLGVVLIVFGGAIIAIFAEVVYGYFF